MPRKYELLTEDDIYEAIHKANTPVEALTNLYKEVYGIDWYLIKKVDFPKVNPKTNAYIFEEMSKKFGAGNTFMVLLNKGFSNDEKVPEWRVDISDTVLEWKYEDEAEREAYLMGYEEGKFVAEDTNKYYDELTEEDLNEIYSGFMELDSSSLLSELRRLAGCEDAGYGTYTDCDEDAMWELDHLIDVYEEGLYDGFHENLTIPIKEDNAEVRPEK